MYLGLGKRPAKQVIDVPLNRLEAYVEVHPTSGTIGFYARYRISGANEAAVLDNMVQQVSLLEDIIKQAYKGKRNPPTKVELSLTFPRFSRNTPVFKQGVYEIKDLLKVAAIARHSHMWNYAVMRFLNNPDKVSDPRQDRNAPQNRRNALPSTLTREDFLSEEYSALSWFSELEKSL